jgi:hypothetical protein
MKRLLLGLSIVIGAWMLSPTPEADAERGWNKSRHGQRHHVRRTHHRSRAGVPELDPSAAGSAMVLLLGGVAYMASRRREEDVA